MICNRIFGIPMEIIDTAFQFAVDVGRVYLKMASYLRWNVSARFNIPG